MFVMMLGVPCLLAAQEPPAPSAASPGGRAIPRPEELEPGVNTTPSSSAAPAPTGTNASSAAPVATPAPAATPAPPTPAPAPSTASAGPATRSAPSSKAAPAAGGAKTSAATHKGPDRLELDATDITGNRELPKVLYIVPWKRSDLGDVVGKPVNSLLDEVLQPLDRDVFRRENRYYDALQPGAGDGKAGAAQGSPNKP
jgi:hypothetical protein